MPMATTRKPRPLWLKIAFGCLGLLVVSALLLAWFLWRLFSPATYDTHQDIGDRGIARTIPESARDITLHSELNGHFVRYRVAPGDFRAFIDELWRTEGPTSAHQRHEMTDEGQPTAPARIENRFGRFGWEALPNAVTYIGPSASNGGGSSYYYDATRMMVYQDTGYW